MTFEALFDLYSLHLQGLRRSASTIKNASVTARDLAHYCREHGVLTPDRLQLQHFVGWTTAMKARDLKVMVIYSRQRQMRTYFAWAALRGHLLTDPLKRFIPPKHPEILAGGSPSEAEVRAMLDAPVQNRRDQRDTALFEFFYGTGLRCAECVAVELDDLNVEGCVVRVLHGKGGKTREVPFGDHLQSVLRHYLDEVRPGLKPRCNALWINNAGTALQKYSVVPFIKKRRELCHIKHFTAHCFRHAYATHMLHRGAPLVALQRLLGHQTLLMTSRYTHLVPADVQEQVLKHHPRGKRKRRGRPRKAGDEV